eukprot:NODE_419_length_928_cov_256.447205_g411_i0.p1 GENE.NODE_419_length_928_cov_256.447205_g411_i0~~NODE_419_length_928_cov_256.447205_g411_i0.p1  ORF type:complete len:221 (+),score=12.89 NODE_419_length_928_cov_256.447205_g411_i0:107-769(+)
MHSVTLHKQKLCRKCKGTGAKSKGDVKQCPVCKGRGMTSQRQQLAPGFVVENQAPCTSCGGTGKKVTSKCPVCGGGKVVQGTVGLDVEIERGIPENHKILFELEGDQSPDILPGDVIFDVRTKKHHLFTRAGNDLKMTMRISLLEALVGFTKTVKHLDGHEVEIAISKVTSPWEKKVMKEEGMPAHNVPSEKGNLIITFEVDMPKQITETQREAFSRLLS